MTPLVERQHAFAHALADLFQWMVVQGYEWSLGDAWRSTDELNCPKCGTAVTYQGLLKYNGRSKVRYSTHNDRCALDIVLWKDGEITYKGEDYKKIGEYWESIGGRWGGHFKGFPDYGHFEF